jgi:peptidoglycan/LPS O-acetylase OafA/YrhL
MRTGRHASVLTGRHDPTYRPGLDGIRALSIIAVLLYHGGVSWAAGGFLGVEAFFVLSGFLITSLLIGEWRRHGTIALRRFWGRRARRLLPALLCLVSVIGIYYSQASPDRFVPGLKSDGIATLMYVGNWHQIAVGGSYFAANGPVSPLQHTWSLAIEEQFYLLWPLLVIGVLAVARRRQSWGSHGPPRVLLGVSILGVIASALDTGLRAQAGGSVDRLYYGTDTRAAGLLVGAVLALSVVVFDLGRSSTGSAPSARRRLLGAAPVIALVGVLEMMRSAGGQSMWLYPYGLLGLDLAVATIIAAVVLSPRSLTSRILSLSPLRAIGKISYGIYLWHFPLFLWLDASSTGVSGASLFALRLIVVVLVSTLSFWLIEQPIRQRRVPAWLMRPLAPVAVGGTVAALLIATSVGTSAISVAAVPPATTAPAWMQGQGPACTVALRDTQRYGLSPLSPAQAARDEPEWLVAHRLKWNGSSRLRFRPCRPKRVLLVGDSIAFTLGVGLMEDEQRYGVEVANAAILGCAFNTRGELNSRGKWEAQYAGCPTALQQWRRDERAFRAQAVVVELGYRDEFDWRWSGRLQHIGQSGYDALLRHRIERYVQVLGGGGVPVLFLSVPWADPAALPDGSPPPAASPTRHARVNAMLRAAAADHPGRVGLLDLDKVVSPGDHFNGSINGHLCRFDGVHLTVYCSRLLQPDVLQAVRLMIH